MREQITEAGYPNTPGYKDRDTSKAAAKSMESKVSTIRRKVAECLWVKGNQTADEVAKELGLSVLAVRPRFSELLAHESISDTGTRRQNTSGRLAKVWRLTNGLSL